MAPGAFLRVSPFAEIHDFAVLNPTPVQGSSSPSTAHGKERGRKREKDRERATKNRDAGKDLILHPGASTCEIVAQTLVPLLPQHLCSEHPAWSRFPLLLPGKFMALPGYTTGDSIPWETMEQTHPSLPQGDLAKLGWERSR